MTEQEINAAQEAAQSYFDEMLASELWRPAASQMDDGREQSLARLQPIFRKFLSNKALNHDQSRYEFLGYRDPPEFSEKIARVESAGKDKVWVYVSRGLIGGYARYLVKKEGGEWKSMH